MPSFGGRIFGKKKSPFWVGGFLGRRGSVNRILPIYRQTECGHGLKLGLLRLLRLFRILALPLKRFCFATKLFSLFSI